MSGPIENARRLLLEEAAHLWQQSQAGRFAHSVEGRVAELRAAAEALPRAALVVDAVREHVARYGVTGGPLAMALAEYDGKLQP